MSLPIEHYISNDFLLVLGKYIPANIITDDGGVTANPLWDEAAKALWFAATGEAFPISDGPEKGGVE